MLYNYTKEQEFHSLSGRGKQYVTPRINPSLTPIIVESCYYYTFSVLAMDSVSYKFLFF